MMAPSHEPHDAPRDGGPGRARSDRPPVRRRALERGPADGRCGEGGLPELPTVTGEPEEKEVKPFDYLEVFKPKSREKIMEIVGRQQIEEDDIPF